MAYLYCPDCGWAIGEFYSLLDLEGKKGDEMIDRYKAVHMCRPPPPDRENYQSPYSNWIDTHRGGA